MNLSRYVTATVIAAAVSFAAHAASPAATNAVKTRQASLKEIGGAFKSINDEIKSGSPDMNTIRPLSRDLANRAALLPRFFPKGSGPESGVKTRAKAEIWRESAAFFKIQGDMIAAARALDAAAASGNVAGLTVARTNLGNTCKSCHDRFRTDS